MSSREWLVRFRSNFSVPSGLKAVFATACLAGAAASPWLAEEAKGEPASCLSPDPAQWPAPSKPYFMIIVDTSGSMVDNNVSPIATDSCGYGTTRAHHARCAVRNTINAFAGQVNFGLAGYARKMSGCGAACDFTCLRSSFVDPPNDNNACGPFTTEGTLGVTQIHRGAEIYVPMLQDHYWSNPPEASNVASLISYVNNDCTGSIELGANSNTPIAGSLHQINAYFSGSYTDLYTNTSVPSPIGTLAQGERSCRPLNIILITDGDETCDTGGGPTPLAGGCRAGSSYSNTGSAGFAMYEADRLNTTGVTVGGQNFKVKTSVIGFAGANTTALDNIASCGGTGTAKLTSNEATLAAALANIIAGAVAPENCDNKDNNCNGCTDEGFVHYCNVSQTCCAWSTPAQRTACLTTYNGTISPANPQGDLTKLPCTTIANQADPANWLCVNPQDVCDNIDNNCSAGADEGALKCGSPAHCPTTEVCNGVDDNCNGTTDEGCGGCVPTPEVCDGCDNDCDGVADDGIAPVACGLPSPANCAGTKSCKAAQPVGVPGGCVAGGGFNNCTNSPQSEVCDGIDNNCDGTVDNGVPPTSCTGNPPPPVNGVGTCGAGCPNFGPNSQCKLGSQACGGSCTGYVGPSAEICDGIDNDCDGQVDEGAFGVGQQCGVVGNGCTAGTTACVSGALVCQGGVQPGAEICDGLDNDCDGNVDEAPLADGPAPGQTGCWVGGGACCTFQNLSWCPPAGGTCNGTGTLSAPCNTGTLVCQGTQHWQCVNPKAPTAEACNGVDDNCNAQVDEGSFPGEGNTCGSNVGECNTGIIDCQAGVLDCVGDIPPTQELCDGKDNDCDGNIDNGISTGGSCTMPYDMNAYPGARDKGACQPGTLSCDGMGGLTCTGGVGPSPEVCDGIDNDCDGNIDETGAAPDGIDGTSGPFAPPGPPVAKIGDACGTDTGDCTKGNYVCVMGQFQCAGGTSPQPETCDCGDNDCDGNNDNPNMNNSPPLCSAGKDCVKSTQGCQCAAPCGSGEFPCPTGQTCETVMDSQTGMPKGDFCIVSTCNNCPSAVVTDANNVPICGPAGTPTQGCADLPVCTCAGQDGCKPPCFGVQCSAPLVCTNFGPNAGKCVADNCFNSPCQGCNEVCDDTGSCKPNPCPGDCKADEVCKPSSDFNTFTCVATCAGVMCQSDEVCHDGMCIPTCSPACASDQFCDMTQNPPTCVQSQCAPDACASGGCCDPATGACGSCPCEGITCPDGQKCVADECVTDMTTTTSSSSSASTGTGMGGTGPSSGSSVSGSGGSTASSNGVFGLATGGGGCSCDMSGSAFNDVGLIAAALGVVAARYRRKKRPEQVAASGEVSR